MHRLFRPFKSEELFGATQISSCDQRRIHRAEPASGGFIMGQANGFRRIVNPKTRTIEKIAIESDLVGVCVIKGLGEQLERKKRARNEKSILVGEDVKSGTLLGRFSAMSGDQNIGIDKCSLGHGSLAVDPATLFDLTKNLIPRKRFASVPLVLFRQFAEPGGCV